MKHEIINNTGNTVLAMVMNKLVGIARQIKLKVDLMTMGDKDLGIARKGLRAVLFHSHMAKKLGEKFEKSEDPVDRRAAEVIKWLQGNKLDPKVMEGINDLHY